MKYRAGSYVCEALAGDKQAPRIFMDSPASARLIPRYKMGRHHPRHGTRRGTTGQDFAWLAFPSYLRSEKQEASGEVIRCSEQHQLSDHRRLFVCACPQGAEVPTPGSTNLQSRRCAHPANSRTGRPVTPTAARNSDPANGSSPGSRPSRDVVMKSWTSPGPPKVQAVTCFAATSITSSST